MILVHANGYYRDGNLTQCQSCSIIELTCVGGRSVIEKTPVGLSLTVRVRVQACI